MAKAGGYVLIAVALMAPLASWLARAEGPAAADREATARAFTEPAACRPEPGERAAFLACALGLPALIFATAALGRRWERSGAAPEWSWRQDAAGLAIVAMAALAARLGVRFEGDYHLRMNAFHQQPGWAAALIPASAALLWWGRRGGSPARWGLDAAAGIAIVAAALARVFDDRAADAWGIHFEAVFHPLVQASLGRTVLVDMMSQYGLYPLALAPAFAATGGITTLKSTTLLAALVAACLAMIWGVLRGASTNRAVALFGLLAVVANGLFPLFETKDLYFQYMPIRVIFPAASAWLAWLYLNRPSRHLYAAATGFLAIGPLWNLDSGLPALAAWVAVLAYGELVATGRPPALKLARIAGHVGASAVAAGLAVVAYSVLAVARSGRLPDFAAFVAFQKIFYGAGFYMLPMPPVGGWWAVAAIDLAGLAYAARALVSRRVTPRSAIVFHLAILGIGLFPYYQGRSHVRVLSLVWWPGLVILAIFLDECLDDWRRRPGLVPRALAAGMAAWVLAGSSWSLAWQGGFLREWYADHLATAFRRGESPVAPDVAAIRTALNEGHRLLTISWNESLLAARLGRLSSWRGSLVETLLVEDFRAMAARIDAGEFDRLYVGKSFLDGTCPGNRGVEEFAGVLERCAMVEETPHGFLLRPNALPPGYPGLLPRTTVAAHLHAVFADGRYEARLPLTPVTLGDRFTIEALIRPDGPQAPRTTLFGNHPGLDGQTSGFIAYQGETAGNDYALLVSDGRGFPALAAFHLEPGRWNALTLSVGDGVASAYVDGKLVDARPVSPSPIRESGRAVRVGDWPLGGQAFRGRIAEVRITPEAIAGPEALARWDALRGALEVLAAGEGAARR